MPAGNWRASSLAWVLFGMAAALHGGEMHVAILGNIPETKSVEFMAARIAVDAFNAASRHGRTKIRLLAFHSDGDPEAALDGARKIAADRQMVGVVALGEEAADKRVVSLLGEAGLATVMASSWSTPRPAANGATWLCPTHLELAEIAATYARKGTKASQVAVVDNGAATAAAAAAAFSRRFRELGGRVDYAGEWKGSGWGLTRTVKALKAHWPQMVFFAGNGAEAGSLAKAMGSGRELEAAKILGLPTLFDPGFIEAGGLAAKMSSVVFPAPDFRGTAQLGRDVGLMFPRASPNFKAYVSYAYRKPGRWTSMIFDGAKLIMDAVAASSESAQAEPGREEVRKALNAISSYRGIRGLVKFNRDREPSEAKAMIFYSLPRVNSREMKWYDKEFGPPFN